MIFRYLRRQFKSKDAIWYVFQLEKLFAFVFRNTKKSSLSQSLKKRIPSKIQSNILHHHFYFVHVFSKKLMKKHFFLPINVPP